MRSLFGYGVTTKAIAKSALWGQKWAIFDDKFTQEGKDEFGNTLLPPSQFDPQISELEVLSPGFNPRHELVTKARHLTSEYDFFAAQMPKNTIFISGTNGKTTTTQMCEFLLKDYGAQMGGNVGKPLATLNPEAQIWILETSSFTLHYTRLARPLIYALLPITPDHLSWHGSFEKYENAKLKPLKMMQKGSLAIVPAKYAKTPSYAKVVGYENEEDLARIFGLDLKKLPFKTPFLLDAALALSVAKVLTNEDLSEKLASFTIEQHKLEEFFDAQNRLWVDDTKATNIDAACVAIKRYKEKFLRIILGGDDKGVDLTPVFEALKTHSNAKIYAIGSNTQKLCDLAQKFAIPCEKCEFLEVAVEKIKAELKAGEVGLLSPACASLDQFSSYAQRGEEFKKFVLKPNLI